RVSPCLCNFRAGRIATPDQPDERRLWDITRQPVPYLDRLLNSSFAGALQGVPVAEDRVRDVLLDNRARFAASLQALGVAQPSPAAVHRAASAQVETIEAELASRDE